LSPSAPGRAIRGDLRFKIKIGKKPDVRGRRQVDNEVESLAVLVGQVLADDPGDNRRLSLLAMQDIAAERPLFAAIGERAINRFDDVSAFDQIVRGRIQFSDKDTPGSISLARRWRCKI
jgi:hypothetical protein